MQNKTGCRYNQTNTDQSGIITALDLLAMFLPMELKIPFAFIVARAFCWFVFIFLFLWTPRPVPRQLHHIQAWAVLLLLLSDFFIYLMLNLMLMSKKSSKGDLQGWKRNSWQVWRKENFSFIEENQVRDCLDKFDVCKSMGFDEIHPWVPSKLVDIIASLLSITLEKFW